MASAEKGRLHSKECNCCSKNVYGVAESLEEMDFHRSLGGACMAGDLKRIERLISKGVDVNGEDSSGYAPLHYAARNGHIQACSLLLKTYRGFYMPSPPCNSSRHPLSRPLGLFKTNKLESLGGSRVQGPKSETVLLELTLIYVPVGSGPKPPLTNAYRAPSLISCGRAKIVINFPSSSDSVHPANLTSFRLCSLTLPPAPHPLTSLSPSEELGSTPLEKPDDLQYCESFLGQVDELPICCDGWTRLGLPPSYEILCCLAHVCSWLIELCQTSTFAPHYERKGLLKELSQPLAPDSKMLPNATSLAIPCYNSRRTSDGFLMMVVVMAI
eukprot:Gb_40756 [translate_table: standard]